MLTHSRVHGLSLTPESSPQTPRLLRYSILLGPNRMSRKEIKLFDLDMSIPCDVESVEMMASVAGTADGRIFMAALWRARKMVIFMNSKFFSPPHQFSRTH